MTINPVIRDFILVAGPSNELGDYATTEVDKILISFFDSEKPPDVKRLVALLRSGELLPEAAGSLLAEILDSRLTRRLACNWQLRPVYVGRYDKELTVDKIDSAVPEVWGALSKRIEGLAKAEGVCVRKFHTVWWTKVKARREWRKQWRHFYARMQMSARALTPEGIERSMKLARERALRKLAELESARRKLTARKRQKVCSDFLKFILQIGSHHSKPAVAALSILATVNPRWHLCVRRIPLSQKSGSPILSTRRVSSSALAAIPFTT